MTLNIVCSLMVDKKKINTFFFEKFIVKSKNKK